MLRNSNVWVPRFKIPWSTPVVTKTASPVLTGICAIGMSSASWVCLIYISLANLGKHRTLISTCVINYIVRKSCKRFHIHQNQRNHKFLESSHPTDFFVLQESMYPLPVLESQNKHQQEQFLPLRRLIRSLP